MRFELCQISIGFKEDCSTQDFLFKLLISYNIYHFKRNVYASYIYCEVLESKEHVFLNFEIIQKKNWKTGKFEKAKTLKTNLQLNACKEEVYCKPFISG